MLLKPTKFYKALPNSSEVSPKGNLLFAGFTPLNLTKSALCLRRSNLTGFTPTPNEDRTPKAPKLTKSVLVMVWGFTLIELLVTIVIITILASVLLITFKGVDERAKLSNLIQFSQSQRTNFFNELVGWWPFDDLVAEGASTTTIDNSFQRNNGVVQGGVKVAKGIINSALEFNEGGYVLTSLNPATTASGLRNSFSIMMWIKPNYCDIDYADQIIYSAQATTNAFIVFYYFGQTGSCGLLRPYYSINGVWRACGGYYPPTDKWTFVNITWDRNTGYFKNYRDGNLVSACSYGVGADIGNPDSNIKIGQGWQGTFKGLIDEVQIYNIALPLAVIQQHYAEGLKRHRNLARR